MEGGDRGDSNERAKQNGARVEKGHNGKTGEKQGKVIGLVVE